MKLSALSTLFVLIVVLNYCSAQLWPGDDSFSNGDSATECTCIPYFQCNEEGEVDETGEGLVDWKNRNQDRPKCEKATDVCCLPSGSKTSTTTTEHPDPHLTDDPFSPTSTTLGPSVHELGCGRRSSSFILKTANRIQNVGEENPDTEFGEFPWMLSLTKLQTDENGNEFDVFICGGSLIHTRVALTAAHCIDKHDFKDLTVRAGEYDTSHENEPFNYQTRGISTIIIHPEFTSKFPRSDIAILVMESDFALADNVNTICVPSYDDSFVDRRCAATGWGASELNAMPTSTTMKKVLLPILDKDRCQELFRTTRLGANFNFHKSFICAGGEGGKDTCSKDGGGPLSCPSQYDKEKFILAGITSWGIGCGEKGIPGAYTDVAHFRNWIDDQLDSFGINI